MRFFRRKVKSEVETASAYEAEKTKQDCEQHAERARHAARLATMATNDLERAVKGMLDQARKLDNKKG